MHMGKTVLITMALSQAWSSFVSHYHPKQHIVFCNLLNVNILQQYPVLGNICSHIALHMTCLEDPYSDPLIFHKLTKLKQFKQSVKENGHNVSTYLSCPLPVVHGLFENDTYASYIAQNFLEIVEEYKLDGFQILVDRLFTDIQFNAARKLATHFANKTEFILEFESLRAANTTIVQAFESITKFFIISKKFINFMNESETLQLYVQAWIDAGIPKHKIIIGFTTYAIQWNNPLGTPMPSTYDIMGTLGACEVIWNVTEYLNTKFLNRRLQWDGLHRRYYGEYGNGTYVSFETTISMAFELNLVGPMRYAGAALTYVDYDTVDTEEEPPNPFMFLSQIFDRIKNS